MPRTNDALLATSQHPTIAAKSEASPGHAFCNGIRQQDEIVLVNTRNICGCCERESLRKGIKVEKYAVCDEAGSRHWQPSDLDSFLAFDPTVPTVIFVHGNQISPWDAKCEGLAVYRCVILHGRDAPPIRL